MEVQVCARELIKTFQLMQLPGKPYPILLIMFVLIRHAGYHMMNGSLTPDGIAVAKELAQKLRNFGIPWKGIWTSPTTRTQETALVISKELQIAMHIEERVGMDGNVVDLLPPAELNGKIIISHLPVLTKILRIWSRAFHLDEPPLIEMGHGYLVDPENHKIQSLSDSRVSGSPL